MPRRCGDAARGATREHLRHALACSGAALAARYLSAAWRRQTRALSRTAAVMSPRIKRRGLGAARCSGFACVTFAPSAAPPTHRRHRRCPALRHPPAGPDPGRRGARRCVPDARRAPWRTRESGVGGISRGSAGVHPQYSVGPVCESTDDIGHFAWFAAVYCRHLLCAV